MREEIRRYEAACRARELAPATIRSKRYYLDRFALAVDKPAAEVTIEDVEDYFVSIGHLAPTTRRVGHEVLHAFFAWLQARGRVAANPVSAVHPARPLPHRPTYYRPEQAAALLAAPAEPWVRLLLMLLLRHGQRISVVLALRWSDVDLDRARISYPSSKRQRPIALALDVGTARQLKAWRALIDGEWVFPGKKGGHRSYVSAHHHLRETCKAVGMPWRGAHEFRRTCVTTLLQMGEPLHVVSARVAGHSNVATTTRYYAGVDDEDVAGAIRRLPY